MRFVQGARSRASQGRVADSRGNHSDDRHGIDFCSDYGCVFLVARHVPAVRDPSAYRPGRLGRCRCSGTSYTPTRTTSTRCKTSLIERIERFGLGDKFGEILVPTEEVVEMREGQKRRSERKFFPGYVLVQMEMDDDTWHLVKEVPKVLGFIGGTTDRPAPITEAGGRLDIESCAGRCRQASAEGPVRAGRGGSRQRWPIQRLQRCRRARQLREEQGQSGCSDSWSINARRTGFRSG